MSPIGQSSNPLAPRPDLRDRKRRSGASADAWAVGETVFWPGRGVGVIVGRGDDAPLGVKRDYLTIHVEHTSMTLMVPVDEAQRAGVRRPAGARPLRHALQTLTEEPVGPPTTWQARIKRNHGKLSGGSVGELAEVVRDLSKEASRRTLGFRERDQHEMARRLLAGELKLAFKLDDDGAHSLLDDLLVGAVMPPA